jgi:BirA family transcriptional regulator, biotin operon repressor / biotin---[acetyl-CoA-carboxylase] ligase
MQLPISTAVFSKVSWFEEIDSTNLELARQVRLGAQDFSAVIAASQTSGQGRLGRNWDSPPGASLSLSILISRPFPEVGWLTLLAALAVKQALEGMGISSSGIKWPNDVQVNGKKICGILAQLLPEGGVVVGIGLNLGRQHPELNAISLEELGVAVDIDSAAAAIGREFAELLKRFAISSRSVKHQFSGSCITIGQQVRAELPGGSELRGLASEVDEQGQLVILTPERVVLSAGDVWHLRSQ